MTWKVTAYAAKTKLGKVVQRHYVRHEKYYFHAGTQISEGVFIWSESTRQTKRVCEVEAKKMSKQHGGRPVVEYCDKKYGMKPESIFVIAGSYYVSEAEAES